MYYKRIKLRSSQREEMHRARYGGRVRSAGRCPILPESLYVRYLDAPCLLYRGHGGRGGLSWLGMHRACTGGAPPLRGQRPRSRFLRAEQQGEQKVTTALPRSRLSEVSPASLEAAPNPLFSVYLLNM